jgi:hypothetical protein
MGEGGEKRREEARGEEKRREGKGKEKKGRECGVMNKEQICNWKKINE